MIKVYLDWNVMAQMKAGSHSVFSEIIKNQDKFLLYYSTSHIGDIFASVSEDTAQKAKVEADLNFITSLTTNLCLFTSGDEVITDYYEPNDLLQQRIEDSALFSGSILDNLQKVFNQDDSTKEIGASVINLLKQIPIDVLLKEQLENPEQVMQLEQVFPGLSKNPTMEGFFNSFSEMIRKLNEEDGYKGLRQLAQGGLAINRDQIYNSSNPYDIISKAHGESGFSINRHLENSKNGPKWFNEISNEYIMLDMHGYQEDKVNTLKGRKETFKNTTEDAFHAAFASTCNFYVTNDNKSYLKTKQVYKKLGINTVVLKPDKFIECYNSCLNIDDLVTSLNLILTIAKSEHYTQKEIEDGFIRTYFSYFFFFDYFNIIHLLNDFKDESLIYILSREKPTNGKTYIVEIIKLVSKLNNLLGSDLDGIGDSNIDELTNKEWIGRRWVFNGISFDLVSVGGFYQLHINFNLKS